MNKVGKMSLTCMFKVYYLRKLKFAQNVMELQYGYAKENFVSDHSCPQNSARGWEIHVLARK